MGWAQLGEESTKPDGGKDKAAQALGSKGAAGQKQDTRAQGGGRQEGGTKTVGKNGVALALVPKCFII